MKKVISVVLTLTMLSSMFAGLSVNTSAETAQYVESFQIGIANNIQQAKDCATKDGYQLVSDIEIGTCNRFESDYIPVSTKKYLPESYDHVYISYKTTTDSNNAIRDIIGVTGSIYKGQYELYNTYNGCTYYSIGGYYLDSDDNIQYSQQLDGYEGIGVITNNKTDVICYLYATKDDSAGTPIQNPEIRIDEKLYTGRNSYLHKYAYTYDDYSKNLTNPMELNLYAEGGYTYLYYSQDKPNYVSALQLGVDFYRSVAKDHAQYNFGSSTLIDVNLNNDCGAFYYGIYLAYQTTEFRYQAIRNIICLSGKEYSNYTSWLNEADGCTYYPVGGYDGNLNKQNILNVNDDGDGEYLYLFYTCDANAGKPLTSLSAIAQDNPYNGTDAVKFTNGINADLNKGAGGDYVYILLNSYQLPTHGSLFAINTSWLYIIIGGIVIIGTMVGIILIKKRKATAV